MKKGILITILLFTTIYASAQYKTFVFGDFKYDTECHYNKNNFITVTINLQSLDSQPIQLILGTEAAYSSFLKRLHLLKTKMIEWDSVCVKNGIHKVDKLIEYKIREKENPLVWFGKYYNSCSPLNAYGRDNDISKVVLHTGEVAALTNRYIRSKGGVIVFNSPQEIEEMISALDLSNMQKYIDDKDKKTELLQ